MYIQSLRLQNLLSFGPDAEAITLGPLNVIIGPNGSGKSNLIEALGLLHATPSSLRDALREGGGITEWLWKGSREAPTARIEALVNAGNNPLVSDVLRYVLAFSRLGSFIEVENELIEDAGAQQSAPRAYFKYVDRRAYIDMFGSMREVQRDFVNTESILSQRRDPDVYPDLYWLADFFTNLALYRDWTFGRHAPSRQPQPADLPNDFLMPHAQNLGLMLNKIRKSPEAKEALMKHLSVVYEGVRDVDVSIEGGTVQVFLHENRWVVPATRLSDGTLRWLSLLTILLSPSTPPVVCIEEPEIGLHPDLLPLLAQLLREASQRMQLIVTTHSDVLVDALTDTPESVIVCEKHLGATTMRRLDRSDLSEWLQKYTLGQLWRRGEIGGNRW